MIVISKVSSQQIIKLWS